MSISTYSAKTHYFGYIGGTSIGVFVIVMLFFLLQLPPFFGKISKKSGKYSGETISSAHVKSIKLKLAQGSGNVTEDLKLIGLGYLPNNVGSRVPINYVDYFPASVA